MGSELHAFSPGNLFLRLALLCGCLFMRVFAGQQGARLLDGTADIPADPSDGGSHSSSCWVFLHFVKSGGGTIKGIIFRGGVSYPNPCNDCGVYSTTYDGRNWKYGEERRKQFTDAIGAPGQFNLAMGGYAAALGLTPGMETKCLWFTQFRHPIPRLVSAFFYCKTHSFDQLCASNRMPAEAKTDLLVFAKHWGNYALRQLALGEVPMDALTIVDPGDDNVSGWYLQKKYMDAQAGYNVEEREPEEVLNHFLKPVQDKLSKYAAVGILEEFNTTLSLFDKVLGMPGIHWHKMFEKGTIRNQDTDQHEEEEKVLADAWINTKLKTYIRLDLLLYEHALDVFHHQTRLHGVA